MREFRISEIDVDKTLIKAQKLAARGQKNGLDGGFKVSIESRTEIVRGVTKQYSVLVIEGEVVKFKDWEFIGVAEFIGQQAITKSIAGGIDIKSSDVKYGYCDYCKKTRSRSKVIFVRNSESGKISQVGSTCVKDFLGWDFNASALVTEEDFAEEFEINSGFGFSGFDTGSVMATAVCAVEKIGYIASGDGISIKDIVWDNLMGGYRGDERWNKLVGEEVTDAHRAKAKELIEFGKTFDGDSGYAQNVRIVSGLDFQKYSTAGILVSIIKAEQNQITQKIEQVSYKNEQFAEVGERVEVEVTVLSESSFESQFGLTTIYTFSNGDYKFKWFSSNGLNVEIGDKIKLKGTVKGVDEYKGSVSTLLTRCKVA